MKSTRLNERQVQTTEMSQAEICRLHKNWAVPIGCGLLFLIVFKCVLFIGYVPSASMEPTIRKNSFIIGVRLIKEPVRSDIAVFERDGYLLVKRIAALPGDKALIGNQSMIVRDGCYYMLGDNPCESIDSRFWDEPFVSRGKIIAIVIGP